MMSQDALGLAANQIGLPHQVMAMNIRAGAYAGQQIVMFNPQVIEVSVDESVTTEGCLSFPNVQLEITRPTAVFVQWQDATGKVIDWAFDGLDAKCYQHEMDHLYGRVFKDRVSELKFQTALRKSRKNNGK